MKVRAIARVAVTVELVGAGGTWGGDCPLEQVHRQAAQDALLTLSSLIQKHGWHVVGEPKVVAILTEEVR